VEIENVPAAPLANSATNVAMSSLVTRLRSSLTAPPAAWHNAAPTGTGRSLIKIGSTAPSIVTIGPIAQHVLAGS
jgi:hypothetical protein